MLFNSVIFIFLYLPIIVFGFYIIGKYSHKMAISWLAIASLFFYGWWDASFLGLLLGSIAFNYIAGGFIARNNENKDRGKWLTTFAVSMNLLLLGYFKYANFFLDNLNSILGWHYSLAEVILPLGISFFTFTQIAFLLDAYQNKVKEYSFIHYTLFVTYFPHLIAGPILHHKDMMSQFDQQHVCKIDWSNMAIGLSIFVLGLAKKELLADELAEYAIPFFDSVKAGAQPMLIGAWIGALAYTFQLYFDFSGYCDMAIGLSLLFNVRMPLNFNSPYKATSIIDFWRRWHMTLSRFLRDYLYIPLGGSRCGAFHQFRNLMITMLLGGLWHGAGWTFIFWGGLHGFYLVTNHAWRSLKQKLHWSDGGRFGGFFAWLLTFLSVVVSWVFFRADSVSSAFNVLRGMIGMNGIALSPKTLDSKFGQFLQTHYEWIVFNKDNIITKPIHVIELILVCFILWFLPNVTQFAGGVKPVIDSYESYGNKRQWLFWRPSWIYLLALMIIFFGAVDNIYKPSPFLYFQF
jgi:alginate O-acetyltransferase complex protein AlgI